MLTLLRLPLSFELPPSGVACIGMTIRILAEVDQGALPLARATVKRRLTPAPPSDLPGLPRFLRSFTLENDWHAPVQTAPRTTSHD
jgi:hypothetical protein